MRRLLVIVLFYASAIQPVYADRTGASFLKIGVGARALGMGSAFTGLANDATATYWNPAGLRQLQRQELFIEHSEWIAETKHNYLAYTMPFISGSIGLSATSLMYPKAEARDDTGQKTGSFDSRDSALMLSVGQKLRGRLSYGFNVKWIQQSIADEKTEGMAMDLGLHQKGRIFSSGLTVRNIGSGMKFESETYDLPTDVTLGVGARLFGRLQFEVDVRQLVHEDQLSLQGGVEYQIGNTVALRSGYAMRALKVGSGQNNANALSQNGALTGINMGLGVKAGNWSLDYAASPSAEFYDAHRLSLSTKF